VELGGGAKGDAGAALRSPVIVVLCGDSIPP